MIEVGKEKDYKQCELVELQVGMDFRGNIQYFPAVDEGWHVACLYDQWGMEGMGRVIICENLEDMNRLSQAYGSGGALTISWCQIPDTHFTEVLSFDELVEKSAKPKP